MINETEYTNNPLSKEQEETINKCRLVEKNNKKAIKYRTFMKAGNFENSCTYNDVLLGKPQPLKEKEYDETALIIDLPKPDKKIVVKDSIFDCINDRKSRRSYTEEKMSLDELSYLLWATQGIHDLENRNSKRTVPSAGRKHSFETYLVVNKVDCLQAGIYRYLPFKHKLLFMFNEDDLKERMQKASLVNKFVINCAVYFIWSTIPYRSEYYYTAEAKKFITIDAGHLCQNLYLATESINCGTVAIGAYDQKLMNDLLKIDGKNEFVIYAAPVGKTSNS